MLNSAAPAGGVLDLDAIVAAFEHRAAALISAMAASSAAKFSCRPSHLVGGMTCVGVPFTLEKSNWRKQSGEIC
jgi:hypothetical protein